MEPFDRIMDQMTLRADFLVDRRRLKRSLALWRLLAIAAAVALVAGLAFQSDDFATAIGYKPHIARVNISGLIREDTDREEMLKDIAKSKHVKAVILRVNSPGGTTVGGESLHRAIQNLRKKKPVVAVFSTVATSAAYMAGIASDHVIARGSSITGSVGVILQWAEVTELLGKLGIKMEEVKSGALKAIPSPFQPLDEAGRALTQEMVSESQKWFVDLVAKSRSIDPGAIPGLTEGRIYSGRQALKLKLIDQLGGEDDAIAWLEEKRKIEKDLKVIDWKAKESQSTDWLRITAKSVAIWTGLPATALDKLFAPGNALERVQLDGLVSVWHAQTN
ncbi:MAG TPA: signal peptide peptidase SppA [Rhizobiales bacterium]|nr:signal peptide peptidase SppA [Hyphomicrobiales bacterium]